MHKVKKALCLFSPLKPRDNNCLFRITLGWVLVEVDRYSHIRGGSAKMNLLADSKEKKNSNQKLMKKDLVTGSSFQVLLVALRLVLPLSSLPSQL